MKKSAIQQAVDKVDAEIALLQEVRGRLVDQMAVTPKLKKATKPRESAGSSGE